MTAESLDPGMTQTGIHFSIGDRFRSYYPAMRYGMGGLMELGFKFGAVSARFDSGEKLGPLAGVDLKYQLIRETEGIPIDMAVDLGYDSIIISSRNASELTFATIISKGYPLTDRGYKIVPYGVLSMTALYGSLVNDRESYVNVAAGLAWKLSPRFLIQLELKAGDNTTGGAGIVFEY
jgi:hypothetical protein